MDECVYSRVIFLFFGSAGSVKPPDAAPTEPPVSHFAGRLRSDPGRESGVRRRPL